MKYFLNTSKHERGFHEVTSSSLGEQPRHRVIDVRDANEYHGDLGHIPGAELVPLPNIGLLADSWDRTEALLVVCRSGKRSGVAVELLLGLGFRRVANVQGGMLAYRAAEKVA